MISEELKDVIESIKKEHPDTAIEVSVDGLSALQQELDDLRSSINVVRGFNMLLLLSWLFYSVARLIK